jgi:predicted RNase H-like HicB family nuclease
MKTGALDVFGYSQPSFGLGTLYGMSFDPARFEAEVAIKLTPLLPKSGRCRDFGTCPNPVRYPRVWDMQELVFEVTQDADGGFNAECLGESIFTQADTWDELRANVREAVEAYFFDGRRPDSIRLRLVRDELLACGWNSRAIWVVMN